MKRRAGIPARRFRVWRGVRKGLQIGKILHYRLLMKLARLSLFLLLTTMPAGFAMAENICGGSVTDWCTSAKDGVCGAHVTEAACRADPKCAAVRYSGESVVACHWDERGFADNCPAVGCQDR